MDNLISVGIGEIQVVDDQESVLVAYGLGSCVGISLYDPVQKVAGMLHAMLPENTSMDSTKVTKYVDSGLDELLRVMEEKGANRRRMIIHVAGGANMLNLPTFQDTFQIGDRNIKAAHKKLEALHLKAYSENVGGHEGRTVHLHGNDGRMTIRKLGKQEVDIPAPSAVR